VKRLLPLLLMLAAPIAHAQWYQSVYCLPLVTCTPTGPQGTTGDPAYAAFGKLMFDVALTQPLFSLSVSDTPASSVNNYSPTGYIGGTTTRLLVVAASGGTTITGLSAIGVPDGFTELLCDQSTTDTLALPHQSSSSTSTNRWLNANAGIVVIAAGACVPVTYVVNSWRVIL
jgi:hypothetical protein